MNNEIEKRHIWNPWHGCRQCSIGCKHCYVYKMDNYFNRNTEHIIRSVGQFNSPILTKKSKRKDLATNRCDVQYMIPSGSTIYVCDSSDFFIEDADNWREQAWDVIRERADCLFIIVTKRPENIIDRLPSDWGRGYDNVALCVTVENEETAWNRIPIILEIQIKHIGIWMEPLYECVDMRPFLSSYLIEHVAVGGESHSDDAVPLQLDWVRKIRENCKEYDVTFRFIKTGSIFINDNNVKSKVRYKDERPLADFYKLNIPDIGGINWNTLPSVLAEKARDEQAYELYRKLQDEYLYYV